MVIAIVILATALAIFIFLFITSIIACEEVIDKYAREVVENEELEKINKNLRQQLEMCLISNIPKKHLQKGDIVKVKNNYFVVVSVNNDDGVFFAATVDAFVYTENSQMYTYSQTNSGWEYINDKVKKVGHITFD